MLEKSSGRIVLRAGGGFISNIQRTTMTQFSQMPERIWKRDARGELRGHGQGYNAVIYLPSDPTEVGGKVAASIYKRDTLLVRKTFDSEAKAKRWANSYIRPT